MLGVFMTGGAFFGLETHFGPQMMHSLLGDVRPVAGITEQRFLEKLSSALAFVAPDAPSPTPLLQMDEHSDWRTLVATVAASAPPRNAWPRAQPYDHGIITFTSGTSGKPKCLTVPTIAFAVSCIARHERLPYRGYPYSGEAGDGVPAGEVEAMNVMFNWEAMRPLCFGATALVIPDDVIKDTTRLVAFLAQHGTTRLLTTPSLLATIIETAAEGGASAGNLSAALSKIHMWMLCGEVVPAALPRRVALAVPHLTLVNDYSTWEGSDVTLGLLSGAPTAAKCAPIGTVIAGVRCAVLHPTTLEPMPKGFVGELWAASPMLYTAYVGAPALTAEKLQPMPPAMRSLSGIDADEICWHLATAHAQATAEVAASGRIERVLPAAPTSAGAPPLEPLAYRTGDLARLLPDDSFMILGRIGSTIKIRGFKIGLPYLEATLAAYPGVGRVAVVPLLDEVTNQPTALVAHLLPDSSAAESAARDEKAWLNSVRDMAKKELAAHELPSYWMLSRELGVSEGESRKLDRKKLPAPPKAASNIPKAATGPALPLSSRLQLTPSQHMEAVIAPIWAEMLSLEPGAFDPDDSFFDLGGHSLLASKLVAALNGRLAELLGGQSVSVMDLFNSPSLRSLATSLAPKGEMPGVLLPTLAATAAAAAPGGRIDLALIGHAGIFPGADTVEELWQMLCEGRNALRLWTAPELHAKGVPPNVRLHPDFVPAAYLVRGAQFFDAGFWGISPIEARIMDPQHRMFLQVAWAALEDAGYAPRAGTPAKTAVFASSGMDGYLVHHLQGEPLKDPLDPGSIFLAEVGSEKDYIATRVSYALDLMGPSLAINSACSSALSAVAQACASLVSRQSDMAIAGGSSLTFPGKGYLFEQGLVSSIDGKVRPFDAQAHGTVFGDSVGAVILKRLHEAIADDDNVLAIIRGCGVTNDGARKAGYAAPGVAGQAAAVVAALEMAGIASNEVTYVECHATGTLVGDGIELRALTEAYAATATAKHVGHCAIGSIKGNIGHANAAAGITGLIKTALCLSRRTLVPTAHFNALNAKVDLAGGPFFVGCAKGQPEAWAAPAHGGSRLAGLSSFGIGGSNVHMVLEEPPPLPNAPNADEPHAIAPCVRATHVITISAKSAGSLGRLADRLATFLAADAAASEGVVSERVRPSPGRASLGRVAHTLHLGRETFAHRAVVVASTAAQAVEQLRAAAEKAAKTGGLGSGRKAPAVVLIFPGQGSQCPRLGQGLYEGEPIYRRHVDRLCSALSPLLGFDLRAELFPSAEQEADPQYLERFNTPKVTQPAIFVTEVALGYTLLDLGLKPVAMAGHSIGEFAAATLAGVFAEGDALELIAARAILSAGAPEGKMLALNADEATALAACAAERGKLWIAVRNGIGRQVLAGEVAAVDRAAAALGAKGFTCRALPVNRAYHTPLMAEAQRVLGEKLAGMKLRPPSVPLCCNGNGTWMTEATATDASYWAAHVASCVRWADNMDALATRAPAAVVEVGSGSSLAPLLAECRAPGAADLSTISTLRHPKVAWEKGVADQQCFGEALASLWERGCALDWRAYHAGERYIKLQLPTYAFAEEVYWVDDDASMYVASSASVLEAAEAEVAVEDAEHAAKAAKGSAMGADEVEPSLVRLREATAERKWVSAYCLAYAGGSSAAFSELARAAPEWMEVIGIEMPGKGARADVAWPGEAPKSEAAEAGASTDPLVGARAEAAMMERLADRLATDSAGTALVLVGWSMGGMLAAELALALTARGCPPQMLHVAGRMAPGSFIAAGDDVDKYLLASDEMKATDAWKEWLLPTLLADLRADARAEQRARESWVEKSAASGAPPLQCMLQVCAGTEDAAFPPTAVDAWRPFTSGAFESHLLSGGHDVLQRCTIELLQLIVAALLPATTLYSVKWVPTAGAAGSAQALPPLATKGRLTWRTLSGSELAPQIAPQIGSEIAAHADEMPAAESMVLSAALGSPLGLLLYVGAEVDVGAQQRQCWQLLRMVQRLIANGAAGRLVLICPADSTCSGLVVGASKAVPLEAPELHVQRVHVPAAIDVFRVGGLLGQIEAMQHGWLRWVGSVAARHPDETDLWIDPSPPHALLAPRLVPHASLPASSAPALDPNGTYLITGGTGGVGAAVAAWLLNEQRVPPANLVLLSRRRIEPPQEGVTCSQADISSIASLRACEALQALQSVDGIFHLAGVLDDGLIANMSEGRLHAAVQPKAGLLELLDLCAERKWRPRWVLNASSTSSLLGYAGQSNYCAANGLLDQMATFGLPAAVQRALDVPPLVLTLNFGPWGEVGMAREGTKAHELSLKSGERPMASRVAIAGIAEALRELRAAATSGRLHTSAAEAPGAARAPHTRGLQFAIADVEWWRSPWPSHSLVQGIMRRVPTPEAALIVMVGDDEEAAGRPIRKGVARKGASFKDEGNKSGGSTRSPQSVAPGAGASSSADGQQRVESFLKGHLSVWQPSLSLAELGLDSLDLVQLRNGFQKAFKLQVPMAYFTNAQQTLEELVGKLVAKV